MIRGPANFNARVMYPQEYHLISAANYLVQYQKHFHGYQVEHTRYFVRDPNDLALWLEIPTAVFEAENHHQFFENFGEHAKFKCAVHPDYLFVCRFLQRYQGTPVNMVPYVKRTRLVNGSRMDDQDDEYTLSSWKVPVLKSWGAGPIPTPGRD